MIDFVKKTALYIGLSSLTLSCYQQERHCSQFKTGKFRFDYEINGKVKTTFFERKDSIEIETFEGKTDTSYIRWVNDCEYILQKKNPKNRHDEKGVNIKILTTKDNTYTFEFSMVGDSHKQRGTAFRID